MTSLTPGIFTKNHARDLRNVGQEPGRWGTAQLPISDPAENAILMCRAPFYCESRTRFDLLRLDIRLKDSGRSLGTDAIFVTPWHRRGTVSFDSSRVHAKFDRPWLVLRPAADYFPVPAAHFRHSRLAQVISVIHSKAVEGKVHLSL